MRGNVNCITLVFSYLSCHDMPSKLSENNENVNVTSEYANERNRLYL